MPGAGTASMIGFAFGRENMVAHANDHRHKHDRVVEEMQFDSRDDLLHDAGRYRRSKQIVMKAGLPDQKKMLEVVPKLDEQGRPPPCPRPSHEALAQQPDSDQHN